MALSIQVKSKTKPEKKKKTALEVHVITNESADFFFFNKEMSNVDSILG